MTTICVYCGTPDPAGIRAGEKSPPTGDFYRCDACGKLSVYTENGLRKASRDEWDEANNDWRKPRTTLPTMISFDGRG